MIQEQGQLNITNHYVRLAEHVKISQESFHIVICMSPEMSDYLLSAKRVSMDTSFKRVHDWQEFEIECWHNASNRCKC